MTFHWRIVRYHIRKSSYFLFYLVINRMYRVVFPSSFQNCPPARNLTEAHVISELTGTDNTRFQVVSLFVPQQFWQGTNRKSIVTLEPPQKKKQKPHFVRGEMKAIHQRNCHKNSKTQQNALFWDEKGPNTFVHVGRQPKKNCELQTFGMSYSQWPRSHPTASTLCVDEASSKTEENVLFQPSF